MYVLNTDIPDEYIDSILIALLKLTPDALNSAFISARLKYGNILTRRKLDNRIPDHINTENVFTVLLQFLEGDGDVNFKSFKVLVQVRLRLEGNVVSEV